MIKIKARKKHTDLNLLPWRFCNTVSTSVSHYLHDHERPLAWETGYFKHLNTDFFFSDRVN